MEINNTIKQQLTQRFAGGLRDIAPDGSEFSLEQFGGRSLGKAPNKPFQLPNRPKVKNQGRTDFCVPYQTSYTLEQDLGVILSPAFGFATAKKRYYKNYFGFGLGIKQGLGSAQHDGMCLENLYPLKDGAGRERSRNYLANYRNIPEKAWQDAAKRKMTDGYFLVDVFKNKFDNFLAAMYHWKEPIITGLQWYQGFYVDDKGRLVMKKTGQKFGHAIGGWESVIVEGEQRIEFQNSYTRMPKFSLSREQCKRLFYGYIGLPIKRPIIEIIKRYSGKIIRSQSGRPPMYIVMDGKKRQFPNENMLNLYGRSLRQYIEVPDEELNSIPTGDPITKENLDIWAHELINREQLKI